MDFTTQLTLLERDRDAAALRMQTLASEPSPWVVEGFAFATAQRASVARGELFEMLLSKVDRLNAEIHALVFGVPHAA